MTKEDHGKLLFSWDFPEFEKHKKGTGWYVGIAIISIALLIYSIYTFNFLFALIVILLGFISFIHSFREPISVKFGIFEDGIELGDRFFPYRDLTNFWIIYDPPEVKNLYIDFKSVIKPTLSIPLLDKNPLAIRKALLDYLEEDLEKEEEPASETIGRFLKL